MRARHAIVGALVLALVGVLLWKLGSGSDATTTKTAPSASTDPARASSVSVGTSPAASASSGALTQKTVRDAKLREEMRRRIVEAWTNGGAASDPAEPPTRDRRYAPMPERADGKIDADYLRQRVKEDFLPMAKGCYNELLARAPKAAGKIVVKMKIVGDEKVGGIVEDATIDRDAGTLPDEKLETCFRESMMSMAFAPPPHGGSVTVIYPFTLAGSDPDAPKEGGP